MFKEIKKHKYFYDGLLLKHFKIYPLGFDSQNLIPVQKEFIVMLMGFLPDMQGIGVWVKYELDRVEIEERDFEKEIREKRLKNEYQSNILKLQAKSKGLSIEEFIKLEAKRLKQKTFDELAKKYNISEDDKADKRTELLEKYKEMSSKLEQSRVEIKKNLLERPLNFPKETINEENKKMDK